MSVVNGVWHDAKIDPPKDNGYVLCVKQTKNGAKSICLGYYDPERTYGIGWVTTGSCNNILYWMPLPKIPEEDPSR